MAPAEAIELPDVMTAGCDEGVEFVFLDKTEETTRDANPEAALPLKG
jgi:hypothetical protein